MGIIALEGLEFFAYHGYYEEEQKIGNRYQVDIQITTDFSEAAEEDKLGGTVNYEDLYRIIASIMKDKIKLLEHIAQRIIQQVRIQYPAVSEIKVSVSKLNPPIGGVCERAKITLIG
ncbi:MAG: dihydroneopterin aldolase [Spirosomataceae bacterium]|jgi:dihydroneopterin aldolase